MNYDIPCRKNLFYLGVHLNCNSKLRKMKSSVLDAVLAIGILKFVDIPEGFLCRIEANKIKTEVENAISSLKRGIISQKEFQKVIFRNQEKLDDVLLAYI